MRVPHDIATLRGSKFLDALAQFSEDFMVYFQAQETQDGHRIATAFEAVSALALSLKHTQQSHIARMEIRRKKGERIHSESDITVDAAIAAARSAFLRALPTVDTKASAP